MQTPGSEAAPGWPHDWRQEIPEDRRRWLRAWLWSIAGVTLGVLVVGGVTRLTRSGLSIVDWDPLMGVIPPLNEEQWQTVFDRYRQFPEYQQLRRGMSLDEFRFIFFWEYFHRLLARLIGVVFLVPFVVFALRGWLTRPFALRALLLFGLGALQGVMGWVMVQSGLVDRPSVSHYRLAAHLSLAFIIFGYAVWLTRELRMDAWRSVARAPVRRRLLHDLGLLGVLLALQIVWGAFVAGLKAGFYFNTFPLMAGRLVPPGLLVLDPTLLNFVQHGTAVQWLHRVLGTLLLLAAGAVYLRALREADARSRLFTGVLLLLIAVQYLLGVVTLLQHVAIPLAVLHQVVALVIFGTWVSALHHARNLGSATLATPGAPGPAAAAY